VVTLYNNTKNYNAQLQNLHYRSLATVLHSIFNFHPIMRILTL